MLETYQQDGMENEEYIKELRHIADHFKSEKGQMETENNSLLDVEEAERFAYASACATHE